MKYFFLVLAGLLLCLSGAVQAQVRTGKDADAELDSLRKLEEEKQDTVIFTAKFIRYTTLGLLQDSTQTIPLDTALRCFHHYNPLIQPERPTVNLGNIGLPYREMLFNPRKSIGFDAGFHSLDMYRLTQDSLRYYRARSPFTSLYYVNGTVREQLFRVIHSQNIKPNWNVGANYFRVNNQGFHTNQNTSHLNGAFFTWYESPNRRYNILASAIYNTLKAAENGSLVNENIFETPADNNISPTVKLEGNDPVRQTWRQKNFLIKQFYYLGRVDSIKSADSAASILPTQRFSHMFNYSRERYAFYKNQDDPNSVFPDILADSVQIKDSTEVRNVRNEFLYSFYLRPRSLSFIKNELKLDAGLQHDFYWYQQMGPQTTFQNTAVKAALGYQFSDRVSITGRITQLVLGENAGDYLYDAQTQIQLSKSAGRVIWGAYIQNKSPERIFEQSNYRYHNWTYNFDNTKINNLSFAYLNPKFAFKAKAEYFLIAKYLYFRASDTSAVQIVPEQEGNVINMLKITANKNFRFGNFNLETFVALQKSDFQKILLTPEIYTYNSFYYARRFSKSVAGSAGFDARWNSKFSNPSYAINVSQFFAGTAEQFPSYPIVDVWAKFALNRANLFVRYDYLNRGLFSNGYYTVNRYPMPGSLFKFGVQWNFYD